MIDELRTMSKDEREAFVKLIKKEAQTPYFAYAYAASKKLKGIKLVKYLYGLFEHSKKDWTVDKKYPPNCKKGCSYCCYIRVDVHKPEALNITKFLKKHRSPDAIKRLKTSAEHYFKMTEGKDPDWYPGKKLPCILLDVETGSCSAYQVRPLACRGAYSVKVDMCRTGWEGTTNDNWWWAHPTIVGQEIGKGLSTVELEANEFQIFTMEQALVKYL